MSIAAVVVTVVAGGLAAVVRYLCSWWFARGAVRSGRPAFPWAVLLVNVVGSAIGGVVLGLASSGGVSPDLQLVLLAGVCGGLTTFSTFSVETVQLVHEGQWRRALVSVAANLVAGFAACALAFIAFGG